jgi:hypothetical protein
VPVPDGGRAACRATDVSCAGALAAVRFQGTLLWHFSTACALRVHRCTISTHVRRRLWRLRGFLSAATTLQFTSSTIARNMLEHKKGEMRKEKGDWRKEKGTSNAASEGAASTPQRNGVKRP